MSESAMAAEQILAGRWARFGAKLIDALLVVIPFWLGGGVENESVTLVGLLAMAVVQVVLLAKDGQTIGKKVLGIRVVSVETGQNAGFFKNVVMRAWVNTIASLIPFYAPIDILYIFRKDRRCNHDHIAGTCVIEV